jgi:RecB family exonuclease
MKPVRAGALIETSRHDRSRFDSHDGVLRRSDLVAELAARFDTNHLFSVDQIETYKACPFRFFVERVLNIEDVEMPVAEFDARVRGTIVHAVLQAFHEQFQGLSVPEIPERDAVAAMGALLATEFQHKAWRSATAPPGVEAVELERLRSLLERYLRIERERNETPWKPTHFEVAFGRVRGEARGPLTRSDPYKLQTPAGAVLFAGRIDRIDRCEQAARIIDYKTSRLVTAQDIREGRSVQLPIYALALEEFLMPEVSCREAYFLQVGRKKTLEGLGRNKKTDPWPERQAIARDTVAACVKGIRDGRFPPTPTANACALCSASRVCRYEPGRVERKESRA